MGLVTAFATAMRCDVTARINMGAGTDGIGKSVRVFAIRES
jgi:hypothetical protein